LCIVISVVLPAHNEEGYLELAVKSVLSNLGDDPGDIEVVIVQNGSTDSTAAEAGRLATEYPNVVVINRSDADYGAALRAGFFRANGDIVVNFDVDLVDFSFAQQALEIMDHEPSAAIVIGTKRGPGARDQRRSPDG
jgi:glycosyltransferase involved in cell wall biosynthesis